MRREICMTNRIALLKPITIKTNSGNSYTGYIDHMDEETVEIELIDSFDNVVIKKDEINEIKVEIN